MSLHEVSDIVSGQSFHARDRFRGVEARLEQLGDLRRGTATFWNWLGPPPGKRPAVRGGKAIIWNVTLDDSNIVLGNIELKDGAVMLGVSSAARGLTVLSGALAGLVPAPLTEIQTVEPMRAAVPDEGVPTPPIPPEVQAELVHDMLGRQYRSLLDEPVPMLGSLAPRAAARSARGRRSLATWLAEAFENPVHHSP